MSQSRKSLRDISVIELTHDERSQVEQLVADVVRRFESPVSTQFLLEAADLAGALPRRIVRRLAEFRSCEDTPGVLIRGIPVSDGAIPPTPPHWRDTSAPRIERAIRREETILMLLAAGVGEVFGYATLQQGNLIHHLLPIQGEEQEQSGHSSTTTLDWHSEDAFTTARCDFLVLMALRNHQGVGTLYAPASVLDELDSADREILSQPRFVVRADDEHLKNVQAASDARLESIHDPERRITMTPILHGGIDLPHLVIDRVFMAARDGDEEASGAFARAVMAIDRHIQAVPLAPGDVFVIDNHRAVHGRAPFNARYDGSDRWLLKVSVTRDLMKSRSYRETAISRVVH